MPDPTPRTDCVLTIEYAAGYTRTDRVPYYKRDRTEDTLHCILDAIGEQDADYNHFYNPSPGDMLTLYILFEDADAISVTYFYTGHGFIEADEQLMAAWSFLPRAGRFDLAYRYREDKPLQPLTPSRVPPFMDRSAAEVDHAWDTLTSTLTKEGKN